MSDASPKTDELVEKIARAIQRADTRQPAAPASWDAMSESWRGLYFDLARACLSAIEAEGMVIVPREEVEKAREAGYAEGFEVGSADVSH